MGDACPHCNGTGLLQPSRAALLDLMRTACRDRSIWLSPDDRVREADAATLVGLQPKTLANRRYEDAPIPFVMRAGRPLYALADLAAWMASA